MDLKDKHIAVIGMARTGIATANFLAAHGARVVLTEQKNREEFADASSALDSKIKTAFGNSAPPVDAELIVLSPGVDINSPFLDDARKRGTAIISEIELAYHFNSAPIIAVTGTNGKTTTTTLIGNLLEQSGKKMRVGGNIGIPFISLIGGETPDYMVLEVSTFQLEAIERFRPKIALILNITPDHLNRHKTMKQYAELKGNIAKNQTDEDFLVLNADDPLALKAAEDKKAKKLHFSLEKEVAEGAWVRDGIIRLRIGSQEQEICEITCLKQNMQWQVENLLAVVITGALAGVDARIMAETLKNFPGLEHRLELVTTVRGIDFVNDSKGTNVGSVLKSLNSFTRPIILIVGGQDKGNDFSPLKPLFKKKVKHLILIGEAKSKIRQILNGTPSCEEADTLETAVSAAMRHAVPGDVVLLSPACASFDMFRDYADRGNQFKTIVSRLS